MVTEWLALRFGYVIAIEHAVRSEEYYTRVDMETVMAGLLRIRERGGWRRYTIVTYRLAEDTARDGLRIER